jgi:hypothetical protein
MRITILAIVLFIWIAHACSRIISCSLKQPFLLKTDFSGVLKSDTFSVAPSAINDVQKLFHLLVLN